MCMLKRERDLFPRPRFYSKCPDARSISPGYAEFILRHIVQQRHQELEQEKLEREKRVSERRRQSELLTDIAGQPKRLIPVDPSRAFSPDQGSDPDSPVEGPESPGSPLIPRLPIPHQESTSSEDSIDSETDPIMIATTKELIETLTKTLKNINQSPTIPLTVFKGKKGEDPEDHILKVEDYFGVHQVTEQKDKNDRFKDTLYETARKWAQTLNYTEVTKFDYDPANANDKIASMKYLFLARFAKEGRTLEAAYSAWGALTFDPNKDDKEQFILKVEELTKKLGYNEDVQVMAVKSVLPRDVYGICMTNKNLKGLKTFLIELFSNPKIREAVAGAASAAGDTSVFSIGQHMENKVVSPTVADVRKICQDMNALQVRFNKITSADFRSKSSKPSKPEVTRGGLAEVEDVGSLTMHREMTDSRVVRIMVVKMGIMVRETVMKILEVED